MKIRITFFSIFTVIFGVIGGFLGYIMLAPVASGKLLIGTAFEPVYRFVYSAGFQNFMAKGNLGPVFYLAVYAVLMITVLSLIFLRVKPVNDSTVPPVDVKQTTYAVDYNPKALVPSMVVVNEEIVKKGGE